jgi:TonB family protein
MLQIILVALSLFVSQTTEPITVTYLESIAYPVVARDAQIQGAVEIEVIVSPDGDVISASANSGHPALKRSAEENIRRWKFAPGAKKRISIVYEFSLEEPRTAYRTETKNYCDLPSRVRVVTTLPARTD